jgi:pyruvate kinase
VRHTKILATVGPASDRPPVLRAMLRAGADAIRLNLSHGTDAEHRATLRRVHEAARRSGREIAVVADVQGPKIRIGELIGGSVELATGDRWLLDHRDSPGDRTRVGFEIPVAGRVARPGDRLLLGDGNVVLRVRSVDAGAIRVRTVAGGTVRSHAGLYLPGANLRVDVLGEKDRRDAALALSEGIDFLALSFVRDGNDVRRARRWLDAQPGGRGVGIIAKIERPEALGSIEAILKEAEGIMVARGDLGIEVPLERLALEQKALLRAANAAGRFGIVATQMLLSMLEQPRPTRAEATDVANAVLDGADAVTLSEESAVGRYPVESVEWLARIAEATEPAYDPTSVRAARASGPAGEPERSVASAAVRLAEDIHARALVTPTHSGRTARLVAALRPSTPIVALSRRPEIRRQLSLVRGVEARPAPDHRDLAGLSREARALVGRLGLSGRGPIVLTAGYPIEGRPTNLLTIVDPTGSRGVGPAGGRAAPPGRRSAGAGRRSRPPR